VNSSRNSTALAKFNSNVLPQSHKNYQNMIASRYESNTPEINKNINNMVGESRNRALGQLYSDNLTSDIDLFKA